MNTLSSKLEATPNQPLTRQALNIKHLKLSTSQSPFNSLTPSPRRIRKVTGDSEFAALVMRRNIALPPHTIDCSGTIFSTKKPKKPKKAAKPRRRQSPPEVEMLNQPDRTHQTTPTMTQNLAGIRLNAPVARMVDTQTQQRLDREYERYRATSRKRTHAEISPVATTTVGDEQPPPKRVKARGGKRAKAPKLRTKKARREALLARREAKAMRDGM